MKSFNLDFRRLLAGYGSGEYTPAEVIASSLKQARADTHNAWIYVLSDAEIKPYLENLRDKTPAQLPLYGIPFAIKDNIDLAGIPTTAACREYSYTPMQSAFAVNQLIQAGAIPIGKTNLDQFATGLNGTRSPYGACKNAFNTEYISGGSSSGSAVAVALGQASFSLGTDTAGSGRVPAAFNNLIGLKPTRGIFSTRGVVPACRSLDCVSVFTLTSEDAHAVYQHLATFDTEDSYARRLQPAAKAIAAEFRFGVPLSSQLEFFGDNEYAALFASAVTRLEELGGKRVEVDFSPFFHAAELLYAGPWVAERYAAIENFMHTYAAALFPVTRSIIERGNQASGVDTFKAYYKLADLQREARRTMERVDVMLAPTTPSHYTIAQMQLDPVTLNTRLGHYTNFMNLLDLAAVAVPAGFTSKGLPFGVTLFADAFMDEPLLQLAQRFHHAPALPLPQGWLQVAVCGAHMSGLPLNSQLTQRGAILLEKTQTSANYRLYALSGGPPYRPGLVRSANGAAIDVEVWALPETQFGSFVAGIPSPLGIGTLELHDQRRVQGFLCESYAIENALDITDYGGWRAYISTLKK